MLLPDRLVAQLPRDPSIEVADALDLGSDRWLLVLAVAGELLLSSVVGRDGAFRRARAGDGVGEVLLERVATGGDEGAFSFRRLGEIGSWAGERAIEVDQSNESTVVGERAVVKRLIRTALDHRRPLVLPAHLVAAGFQEMPAPLGNAAWRRAGALAPLATVTRFLPDATDGWEWYVDLVERSIDDPSVDAIAPAAALGALTARLHASLATPTDLIPAPGRTVDADGVARWRTEAERDLDAALSSIDGEEGRRLRAHEEAIRSELAACPLDPTTTIPIHGDLHVGQFLLWREGLAVSDLDGDPLGSGAIEGSPARDVASLVQSIDHVGRIVERRRGASVGPWIEESTERCLRSYRDELAALGAISRFDEALVRLFRVAQELHEYVYAATYLPTWRYVPDRALASLLAGRA